MPGGVCRDLSAKAHAELVRRWPALDADLVNSASKNFQLRLQHRAQTPPEIRKTMDKLAIGIGNLKVALRSLPEEASDHLWQDLFETGQEALLEQLPFALDRMQAAAMRAHNAEIGNDARSEKGARHQLIVGLASQLQNVGIEADARPKGDLCRLLDLVLDDLADMGVSRGDIRSTVRDALKQMSGGD
jgi:hypothetical protein